jgi:hypothetical protein
LPQGRHADAAAARRVVLFADPGALASSAALQIP